MKLENVGRAATLASALAGMDRIIDACARPEDGWYGQFGVGHVFKTNGIGAPDLRASVLIDCATGKRIAEAAKAIMREELVALGVEL